MHSKKIRRIRISILKNFNYYSFCWIEFLENGSFSLGFLSEAFRFTEYGSAVINAGHFSQHTKIIPGGNVDIKEAISPHITYHTPKLWQKKGIVHMKSANGIVDEFELDWFPVKSKKMLLCLYSGEIERLNKDNKKKSRYQIVDVPPSVKCLRMEVVVYPRFPKYPMQARVMHIPEAIANIHGGCPDYILSCYFYKNEIVKPQFYYACK